MKERKRPRGAGIAAPPSSIAARGQRMGLVAGSRAPVYIRNFSQTECSAAW